MRHEDTLAFAKTIIDSNPPMAVTLLESILKTDPKQLEALQLLGICKLDLNISEATEIFLKLIDIDPTAANYANLAICHSRNKSHDLAIIALNKAIEINPNEPLLWSNLAIQHRAVGDYTRAFESLEHALQIAPNPVIWNNLAGLHTEIRNFSKAAICYAKAIEGDPEYVTAHVNLGLVHHFQGDWQAGFKEFEWRFWHYPDMQFYLKSFDRSKAWHGQPLVDKSILIHCEQGLGDIIMFARFAKNFKELGAHVTLNVHSSLVDLIKHVDGVDVVVNCDIYNKWCKLPDHDFHISSVSAPYLLGLTEISGSAYIPASDETTYGTIKVGVVWSGSPNQPDDIERSIPYDIFKKMFSIQGIEFVSLQIDQKVSEIPNFLEGVKSFEDTRLQLNKLDLIIGCQTSVMHLAGAMGKPTWTLLAYDPDWRWGTSGDRTFWYDNMLLFRQKQKGNWEQVIEQVMLTIENKKAEQSSAPELLV